MWLKYRHALTSAEIADMVRGSIAFMSSVYKLQLYLPVSQDWDDERMLDEFSARYPDRCIMMEVTMQMYEEARLKARAAKKACKDAPPALETITAPGGEETDWFSIEEAERRYNIVKFTDMARGYMSDERLAEVIRPEVLPSLPEGSHRPGKGDHPRAHSAARTDEKGERGLDASVVPTCAAALGPR